MARFLATLHSPLSKRGGIAIIDSDQGVIYLQSDDIPGWIASHQLRGIAFQESEMYITTPAGILVFSVETNSKLPIFRPKREIVLQEWLLGALQADLLGIFVSLPRGRLLVANNLSCAIDEFTLAGVFIKRNYLHQISPDLFAIPREIDRPFKYGHIRNIFEAEDGSIFISIHGVNGSNKGCVMNFDSGEILLDDLLAPSGGIFVKNRFFIQESGAGRLSTYLVNEENYLDKNPLWIAEPEIELAKYTESTQTLRGMVQCESLIYCGVFHPGKDVDEQIPPHIVSFHRKTGQQINEHIPLPDGQGFVRARVFFMAPLPLELKTFGLSSQIIYSNGKKLKSLSGFSDNETELEMWDMERKVVELTKPVIALENVSLSYRRTAVSHFSFKRHLRESKEFHALKNISFTIYEGETVGIIGRNGSGKSTISKLISGALQADGGTIKKVGHVQLLSIGLGFQPKLTGRENVFINGALLDLSKSQIVEKLKEIEDFAEIGEFMDEPVRTYSAGMRSRLGFAIATAVRPDVLILDEVMSTGDIAFRKKANERMAAMREQTKTIIMVSHNSNQIKKMCSRVIWLNKGELMMDGTPELVFPHYQEFCKAPDKWKEKQKLATK